jgi:chromate transport protein ChrA
VSLVYGFLFSWPFLVYLSSKYALNVSGPNVLQLACLFGYSLALYLPATVLATVSILAWPALLGACATSSMFLYHSLHPTVEGQREKAAVTGGVILTQLLLAILFKAKFYRHGF